MARIRTGKPNGRPPLARGNEGKVDFHVNIPSDIMDKIDRLKRSNESRKDVIVRLIREYPE